MTEEQARLLRAACVEAMRPSGHQLAWEAHREAFVRQVTPQAVIEMLDERDAMRRALGEVHNAGLRFGEDAQARMERMREAARRGLDGG